MGGAHVDGDPTHLRDRRCPTERDAHLLKKLQTTIVCRDPRADTYDGHDERERQRGRCEEK
jgi:hypothetical protein